MEFIATFAAAALCALVAAAPAPAPDCRFLTKEVSPVCMGAISYYVIAFEVKDISARRAPGGLYELARRAAAPQGTVIFLRLDAYADEVERSDVVKRVAG